MSDGTEHPPPPEVPPGFVRYDPEGLSPSLAGPAWIPRRRGGAEATECDRWELRHTSYGMVRERRYRESFGSGRYEMVEFQPLHGGPLVFQAYCVGYRRRWIRRPGPMDGLPALRGACGAVWPVTILAADAHRITWIEAGNVLAYHPDYMEFWFRTEEACEASLAPASQR